ncbi:ABC transporter permease [Clostridium sp. JS66]|uniref:ABC transporter permease n=1 Tax=Clostridium sp. JS66 TaxID=3064705 RepID=UPI00298D6EF7|nr:ABC transporter permease [Clostridium sp. JS66]WPC42204.1 ABC transporter permease [Clostridium sp. JS66]
MKDIVCAEFIKMKRKRLFLLALIGELLSFLVAYVFESRPGSKSWMNLLYNFSGFNFMIMIIVFTIIISKIVDIEHKSDMWKIQFISIEDKKLLYIAKFICVLIIMFFSSCITFSGLILLGNSVGIKGIAYSLILKQSLCPLIGYLPFIILQLSISIMVKNQGVSIACGVIGCFLGVLGFALPFGKILIWMYPFFTAPMITASNMSTVMNESSIMFSFISIIVAAGMAFISLRLYDKKEDL